MKTEEVGPGITLIQGDCLEVMDDPHVRLDYEAVIADPPYGHGHWKRKHPKDKFCRPAKEGWDEWSTDWLNFMDFNHVRVLSFCPQTRLGEYIDIAQANQVPWRLLMMLRPNPKPRGAYGGGVLDYGFEPIFTFGKIKGEGRDYKTASIRNGAWVKGQLKGTATHPHQKPLAIMRWLVRLAAPVGATILDPFAGSGTTGVACVLEGRKCVMIEREIEYCEIVRRRLDRPWPKPQWVHARSGCPLMTDPVQARNNGRRKK
jgi:site-specific DNA-methyltransferase (adenine-specific)